MLPVGLGSDIKYLFGTLLSVPLLPVLYFQGKRVKATIPNLPEATGPTGTHAINGATGPAINLITLGESTMAGVGVATHQQGFTGTLAKTLAGLWGTNINWQVYAKSGYTVAQVTKQLVPAITEKYPHLIVIGLGANDAFALNQPWRWRRHLVQLIEALQAKYPQAHLVFTNMPPIKAFPAFTPAMKITIGNHIELLGHDLYHVANKYSNVYYDGRIIIPEDWIAALGIKATPADFFSDGVHPSLLTYQTWAKQTAKFIHQQAPALKP